MNYQKELEKVISEIKDRQQVPRLLLHSCCAPCSSYVLEYLSEYFAITVYYYNPNISPIEEYEKRVNEQQQLIQNLKTKNPVVFVEGPMEQEKFYEHIQGLEHIREGGKRCVQCFEIRLRKTAELAKRDKFDFFTTTLSISPLKNAVVLNEMGIMIGREYGVAYLPADFKKKNGYKRSVELSDLYGLYRQDYCGCEFSKRERELDKADSAMIN